MENDWGIRSANQSIGSPNYSAQSAFNIVTDRASKNVPTSFNLMMYEDGSVAQASLDVLTGLKALLVNTNGQTTINNDDSSVTYAGGTWTESNNRGAGDYSDDVSYTGVNGSYVEYSFSGTGIKLIGPSDPSQGNVEIFIDNVSQGVVNTYGTPYSAQTTYFETSKLTPGSHTIKMVKQSGTWMQVDAFTVTNIPTELNNTDSTIVYNGNWNTSSNRSVGDYQDDVAYTTVNGDYLEYTFTGSGIEVISEKYSDQGNVEIIIDSQPAVIVDTTNPTRLTQQVIFSKLDLTSGSHTIRVTKQSGNFMLLDSLKVTH
jgi:hypothetical protein